LALSSWSPAPVPAEGIDRALRPLGEATMLPAEAYTGAEVLAWERRHLFAGGWACLGRVEDVFADGATQRARRIGDVSVLLTRSGDGPVAAFANTCRHRGHELLAEGGEADRQTVVCPYHAWTYHLDGALRAAPGFRDVAGFDPAAHGLVELPAYDWHGWLLVNATGDAAPLTEYVGGLAQLVAPYAPERLRLAARHTYEVAANWKIIVENYHECYHCPLIHPELCQVSPPTSGDNFDLPGAWVGGTMTLRDGAETMSLSGRSAGQFLSSVDPGSVCYVGLMPNLLLSLHPDYVMAHLLEPLEPGVTSVECSWYMPESVRDATYAVEFWDRTNRQDWAACESVQRGVNSPHFRPGPFAPNEDAVHQWVTMIGRAYRGIPPWSDR
jgi:Rieske 2Fe-2S family protein